MNIINNFKNELANNSKKTIILTESEDIRVLKAIEEVSFSSLVNIILIGNKNDINNLCNTNNINLNNCLIIDNNYYNDIDKVVNYFYETRKHKGISIEDARKTILNSKLYFGCMLVKMGIADGLVCGSITSSSEVLGAALRTVGKDNKYSIASSFFLMNLNDESFGYNGAMLFSDCGMNINPSSEELAVIAYQSSISFKNLIGADSKVALLSYSTLSSGKGESVDKVKKALEICKNKYPNLDIEGELQLDAAISPEVYKLKTKEVNGGDANTLIFPDLNSGNIGYKLVERFAHAKAYGPICQGLNKPVNDLSRGCKYSDIVATIYITAIQAIKK